VNLMRLLLALFFVVMLAFTASAATENVTTGPYTVSFDLNSSLKYSILSGMPVQEEIRTAYPLLIKTNNSTDVKIVVFEYKGPVDSTPDLWQNINFQGLVILGMRNVTQTTEMVIDGMPAYGLSGNYTNKDDVNKTLYSANYWLDSNECECGPVSVGKTNVVITSTLPLEVTGHMLDTLHVSKSKSLVTDQGPITFAPPKA